MQMFVLKNEPIGGFVCKILTKQAHEKKRWDIRPTEREYWLWIMARAQSR